MISAFEFTYLVHRAELEMRLEQVVGAGSAVPALVNDEVHGENPSSKNRVVRSQTETLRERNLCSEGVSTKPKEPRSLERPKDDSDDPSLCVRPHSPTYEIRPSPLPDLSALPADDIQARALANLRLQSRNSFTVIPKRRRPDMPSHRAVPSSDRAVIPSCSKPALSPNPQHRVTEMQDVEVPRPSVLPPACTSPSMTKEEGTVLPKAVPDPQPDPPVDAHSTPSPSIQLILDPPVKALLPEDPMLKDQLPVTKTANVSVEPPQAAISSAVLFRKGNTFTVVPKCTVYTESASLAPQQPPSQAPKQAPYAELGSLLKKRYPKAEEIEVVGGYVSLSRSCLSKTSARKKLKISFNESCLHSTFEYPSESSQWDSEEDQNGEEAREEGDTGTTRFLIPCSNLKSCPILSTNSISEWTERQG
ncbi:hypothetical protein JZ751_001172 [Albula glossodonta]|uniref:Phostensin/Taperin PP1-binding domain-containing protein n=1 Tax=Albula glossodonta TaxID=121402 RepID=A0A8T2PSR3_9TELE|nr:hypothetical protein JZ751_001172 [Albula glossodonta]